VTPLILDDLCGNVERRLPGRVLSDAADSYPPVTDDLIPNGPKRGFNAAAREVHSNCTSPHGSARCAFKASLSPR
jgi:hypothetical protein